MRNDETYKLISSFIKRIGIRIDALSVRDAYDNHPLPHSIRAISDSLDYFFIKNIVSKISFEQLIEISTPVITIIGINKTDFFMIEKVDHTAKKIILNNYYSSKITLTFEQFKNYWTGYVLVAERAENTIQVSKLEYTIKQILILFETKASYYTVLIVSFFLVWIVILSPQFTILDYIMFSIKTLGIIISTTIIYKTFNPQHLKRFCTLGKNMNCDSVLHSKESKIFGWISLGELSLAFFSSSLIWGIFLSNTHRLIFLIFDSLAMLFVLFSLAWQIKYLKWCTLCMLVDFTVVLGFIVEFIYYDNKLPNIHLLFDTLCFSLVFLLFVILIKQITEHINLKEQTKQLNYKKELLLRKRDVFSLLLSRSTILTPRDKISPISNNLKTEHSLTVFMSPSCPNCGKLFNEFFNINNYRIDLIFVVNESDLAGWAAALSFIAANQNKDWNYMCENIKLWFNKKIYIDFTSTREIVDILTSHRTFCIESRINRTPYILIDGHVLPDIYDPNDLRILLI